MEWIFYRTFFYEDYSDIEISTPTQINMIPYYNNHLKFSQIVFKTRYHNLTLLCCYSLHKLSFDVLFNYSSFSNELSFYKKYFDIKLSIIKQIQLNN